MIEADQNVDARYEFLRNKHGQSNPQANGYRLSGFFAREQRLLLRALEGGKGPFLDVACGSGLMLAPLLEKGHVVYGLDFNKEACVGAYHNGIRIARGDAFQMPFADGQIGQIVNCQFLNQQNAVQSEKFIQESARILQSGGRLIILWRHARSLIHKSAHAAFRCMDRFTGQPPFPQYEHSMEEIEGFAKGAGLEVKETGVTLPFLKPDLISAQNKVADIIGASLFIVLQKP